MQMRTRRWGRILVLLALMSTGSTPAAAIEVGEPAPDFRLPSTFGNDVTLSEYRGKKWVLIEFYSSDFAPT